MSSEGRWRGEERELTDGDERLLLELAREAFPVGWWGGTDSRTRLSYVDDGIGGVLAGHGLLKIGSVEAVEE